MPKPLILALLLPLALAAQSIPTTLDASAAQVVKPFHAPSSAHEQRARRQLPDRFRALLEKRQKSAKQISSP
jgi:hypothetical protein